MMADGSILKLENKQAKGFDLDHHHLKIPEQYTARSGVKAQFGSA
jgi:hypothetical protein